MNGKMVLESIQVGRIHPLINELKKVDGIMIFGKEDIVNYFGYWPEFCDARILELGLKFSVKEITLLLEYIDNDKGLTAKVTFTFTQVYDFFLSELTDGAVLDLLEFREIDSGGFIVLLQGAYGIVGKLSCHKVSVKLAD